MNCVGCDDYLKLKSTEDCVLAVFILRSNLYFPICLFVAPLSAEPGWQHSAWPPLSATFSKLIRLNYSAINSGYRHVTNATCLVIICWRVATDCIVDCLLLTLVFLPSVTSVRSEMRADDSEC